MRLWSLHPRYLDAAGLTACWRVALLAQRVLAGGTRGYRDHPQLERFRMPGTGPRPGSGGGWWPGRGGPPDAAGLAERVEMTDGQLVHEWTHLRAELAVRSPDVLTRWRDVVVPDPHPLFVPGPVSGWQRPPPNTRP